MKQIILPVTVHLNIRLPLALLQPEPADAPTGPEPEAHACQGCGNCGGGRGGRQEEKEAANRARHGAPPGTQGGGAGDSGVEI